MTTCDGRRRTATAVLVVATAAAAVIGVAGPAGAENRPATRPVCVRVETQFARVVAANSHVKAAFDKAQALQNRLVRAGRVTLAHRLDTRVAHLRALHAALVTRLAVIAARAQGRCPEKAPTLSDL